ncbi:MAG: Rrf2 family transcriptional regulator [Armatimonadetes bacterium]|nr:Rrf2 family transcriptional regulator [Armatimonadota bacterium]
MRTALRVSEATSLALHAMALLAQNGRHSLSCNDMASTLSVSEAHLSKVLQRLGKQGFVSSTRGPKGGFRLARSAAEVSLLDVYEAIDGPAHFGNCLFEQPVCEDHTKCIMGDLLSSVDQEVMRYLQRTKLTDLMPLEAVAAK